MADTFLVGIDGSAGARRALRFAGERAQASGAKLVLAFVFEWSHYDFLTPEELETRHRDRQEEIERSQREIVEPALAEVKASAPGVEAEGTVRHGHAAEALSILAEEVGAAQIFIGRRGTTKLSNLLFGSVASNLVQISPVSVTVVP
ncbi:MAG: universal stress protein [Rhodospirillales bacterium]